ncbi:hypothetical protein GCM10010492_60520 [Saccharothrix mutabilis subsp. mutabilis]|uniref:ORC1/DEAH AAA+ ATPase domain-containing protein n=1 Tax=Saccharothrix mutabilis subsp. mutabilis TaxID=66855 RepID=A0ABN0UIR1_9PSEU
MTSTMKGFRCWSARSVRETVFSDIGQLPSESDALFLAAHTPMAIQHREGPEVGDAGSGEQHVLSALMASFGDPWRNSLIAVTGDSGAGKSHVVRWVHANLPKDDNRFHVLYVPRAVQTIRQLLKRIIEGLPGEGGAEIMERVDAAVGGTSPNQLRDRLLEEMRHVLTWVLEPSLPAPGESQEDADRREARTMLLGTADSEGKRRNGLADLLNVTLVNASLLRSGGLLDRFVASVYEETSRRNEQQDGFTEDDLPFQVPGVVRALSADAELLDLWRVAKAQRQAVLRLLDEALRAAAPRTLGFRANNGETLDSLFRRSRQLLHQQGKELVLLFEDLVQFGLIDGELYDQFTTQPGEDLAPLRVVFAVTGSPFSQLRETVRTRITHWFTVNPTATVDRREFVARYLNLVRVGRADVEASWVGAVDDRRDWLRNACDTREEGSPCRFRDECHAAFGTVDVPELGAVGLYPYNEVALRRGLAKRGTNATPRSILDVCVREQLIEADAHIAEGDYPHERLRERFDFTVRRSKEVVVGRTGGEQAERLYRALVLWADEGELAPTVAEAFSLQPTRQKGTVVSTPVAKSTDQPAERGAKVVEDLQPSPLNPLFQWQNSTEEMPAAEADEYRMNLRRMVLSRLNLDLDLFHTAGDGAGARLLEGLLPRHAFVIEDARGRKPAAAGIRFDLTREPADVRVLIAAKWFWDHGTWDPGAGKWPWPDGYEPFDLMLVLEHRLDQWAAEVRRRFIEAVANRDVARAALGVRAVCLLALGTPPNRLSAVNDVLSATPMKAEPLDSWSGVDSAARDVLGTVSPIELIAQFAAVRQGETGSPQLIDAVGLELDLKAILDRPVEYLRRVEKEMATAGSDVAAGAKKLAAAVDKAAAGQLSQLVEAMTYLDTVLDGHHPKEVAKVARETGELAVEHGLFRPADAVSAFREATDLVERMPSGLPLGWRGDDGVPAADQVLAAQAWAAAAIRGASAMARIKNILDATRAECARNDGTAEDLQARTAAVRSALSSIRKHIDVLRPAGGRRG